MSISEEVSLITIGIIGTSLIAFIAFCILDLLDPSDQKPTEGSNSINTTSIGNKTSTQDPIKSPTTSSNISDSDNVDPIFLKLCTTSNTNTKYSESKTFNQASLNSINNNTINDIYSNLTLKELLHKELELGRVGYDDLRSDYEECLYILDKNNITKLYHFTSVCNLKQIKTSGGLLSWNKSQQNRVKVYNSILSHDSDCGCSNNDDYVHLSFCVNHPMAYRLSKAETAVALLEINPIVALFKNTIFCDMDAGDPACSQGGKVEDLERINLAATQMHFLVQNSPYFKLNQAEVMVKTFIPKWYICNLNPEIELFQKLGILTPSCLTDHDNSHDEDIPF